MEENPWFYPRYTKLSSSFYDLNLFGNLQASSKNFSVMVSSFSSLQVLTATGCTSPSYNN